VCGSHKLSTTKEKDRQADEAMLNCSVSNTTATKGRKGTVSSFQTACVRTLGKGNHRASVVLETSTWGCAVLCLGYSLKTLFSRARDVSLSVLAKFHVFRGGHNARLHFLSSTLGVFRLALLNSLHVPAKGLPHHGCG